jgi:hypothetical protein
MKKKNMLPFILLQRLDFLGFLVYQIIQSILDFVLIEVFLYLGLCIVLRDRSQIEIKSVVVNGIIIEVIYVISSIISIPIMILGGYALFIIIATSIIAGFIVIYLTYYEKNRIDEKKIAFLLIITIIPALLVSVVITNTLFILFGVPKPLVYNFI